MESRQDVVGHCAPVVMSARLTTTLTEVHRFLAVATREAEAMLELVGSELVKRAAERAKRREERLKAQQEGREPGEEEAEQ